MSAAELVREIILALFKTLMGVIGWAFITPIVTILPRHRDWMVVIGRDEGKFVDNTKYFFLQCVPLVPPGIRVVWITERGDITNFFKGTDYEVMLYPSLKSVLFLMRAGTIIVDSSEWVWKFRRFLLAGSKKIQLWHGVGYKRIELDKWKNEVPRIKLFSFPWMFLFRKAMKFVNGRLVRYDAVNTTSHFYLEKVFKPAMLGRKFIITGYPRNTFGELKCVSRELVWKNVDKFIASHILQWQKRIRRVVLVAPTYKDSRGSDLLLDADTISMLDKFCERNMVEIVFKFHPLERDSAKIRGKHLHLCDPDSDLYPLMPLSSALITDYSSIYMDYILLDKPILFLVPDLEEYISKDRQFQFDFIAMTPGPKLTSWEEITLELLKQWEADTYSKDRARLRKMAFDGLSQVEAVPKLIQFMFDQGWLQEGQ